MKDYDFSGDFSIGDLLFMLLIMILLGVERLSHIEYLRTDPLFRRVTRLTRIPHRTKLATALKQFTSDSLKALVELNSELVVEKIQELGLYDLTVDLDGTVISTRGNPSWSFKGYNPIKKGANSYFPLTAHIAETGHFLSITNRPGNVHDSNRALSVIKNIRRQLDRFSICFRADSAFCVPDVINYLLLHRISFAIKAPFWKLNGLKSAVQQRKRWFRINKRWSYFWVKRPIVSIDGAHYVMILRKQVAKAKKPYQLQLFSPNNGTYEYSAIVTGTKKWKPEHLLDFVSGRSAQEKSIGELKTHFAFDHIPTNTYQANSAYMQISQMAYNSAISMQSSMGLSKNHKPNSKRTRRQRTMGWNTFKFLILNRAGRINKKQGVKVLEMTKNPATEFLYENILASLSEAELKKAA
jgi:hypothetical protein